MGDVGAGGTDTRADVGIAKAQKNRESGPCLPGRDCGRDGSGMVSNGMYTYVVSLVFFLLVYSEERTL